MEEYLGGVGRYEGTAFARIDERYNMLRASEKRVADFILKFPEVMPELTITELARRTKTSEATVTRLCHSLEYSGFRELRIALAQDVARSRVKVIPQDIIEQDGPEEIAQKVSRILTRGIAKTWKLVDPGEVEKAVRAIAKARTLCFYGVGGSGSVARLAHHLFLKAGLHNVVYDDGYMQSLSASLLTGDDVVVGISHLGNTTDVINALEIADQAGATTIAITGKADSKLAEITDIVLLTYAHRKPLYGDFVEARISQIYVIDVLYIGTVLKSLPQVTGDLERTAEVIAKRRFGEEYC